MTCRRYVPMFRALLFWLVVLATRIALAQSRTYTVDPARSSVAFTLSDVLHTVHGSFAVQTGEIGFDSNSGSISGQIVVSAASGDSGNKRRDERMTKDELEAKLFPTVTFSPSRFSGTVPASGLATVQVEGIFTLLGKAHSIRLPMKLDVREDTCTATGSFSVPYVQWGLKDPSTFVLRVNKEVQIDLRLSGRLHS
jgi:polyisoprenoid-binding protein YceI